MTLLVLMLLTLAPVQLPAPDRPVDEYLVFDLQWSADSATEADTLSADCTVTNVSPEPVQLSWELRIKAAFDDPYAPVALSLEEKLTRAALQSLPIAIALPGDADGTSGIVLQCGESSRAHCDIPVVDLDAPVLPAEVRLDAEVWLGGPDRGGTLLPMDPHAVWIR